MKKWEDSLKERLVASPNYAAEYLIAVLEESDPETLCLALQHVADAQGTQLKRVRSMTEVTLQTDEQV
jgi:DNA-binding phage protein